MRFHVGKVDPNPGFDPGQGDWRKIREPGMGWYYLLGLPLAAVTVGCLSVAIAAAGKASHPIVIRTANVSLARVAGVLLLAIGGFVALLVVHEGIHLLAHPGNGRSRDSIVGVWPSRAVFYAHYDGEISRNRFILMVALPFLALSVAPVALFWAVGTVYLWLVFVVLLNGIASCFDLLVIAICLAQVPARAVLRNRGWDTYWKPVSSAPEAGEGDAGV
jgi:hypothetical protein